jgi:hypothetical protein
LITALAASIKFSTDNGPLIPHSRIGVALVLLGFIGSFGFIRMSTRIMRSPRITWWPGSVTSGEVHVHHLVFGIVSMMLFGTLGFLLFDYSPWFEISALFFGIGIGLTIDEFALWVYLDDVYWAKEGRKSIDATVIAVALMGLIVIGVQPLDFDASSTWAIVLSVVFVTVDLVCVVICFMKGRMMHGLIGFFISALAIYGALRLGKPNSPWGRRYYGERNPDKQKRAEQRFRPDRRTERFKEKFRDAIGGTPEDVYEAKLAAKKAEHQATQDAVDTARDRAEQSAR